jgi:hypothetical protein
MIDPYVSEILARMMEQDPAEHYVIIVHDPQVPDADEAIGPILKDQTSHYWVQMRDNFDNDDLHEVTMKLVPLRSLSDRTDVMEQPEEL